MSTEREPGGVLAFWTDVPTEHEADFNEWYNRQHFPERLAVPGFLRGARYRAVRGEPAYFAFYEVKTPTVLTQPAYVERLDNPTEWTQSEMARMRNSIRSAFIVYGEHGAGMGGMLAALRLAPEPGREKGFREEMAGPFAARLCKTPGIFRVLCLEGEEAASRLGTKERRLRGDGDESVEWALLVEASGEAALEAALADHLNKAGLRGLGAPEGTQIGFYRLLHARAA